MLDSKLKYKRSEKGKLADKKYKQGKAGKLARRRYKRSKAYKEARKREYQKNKWKYSLMYDKKRKMAITKSIPPWLDKQLLLEFYDKAPIEMTVDHIIPLRNRYVCGLSVPWNFQYLTKSENSIKSNSFDWTYDNKSWKLNASPETKTR